MVRWTISIGVAVATACGGGGSDGSKSVPAVGSGVARTPSPLPADAAMPPVAPAPVAPVALPGSCVPVPDTRFRTHDAVDFDGDGVNDVIVTDTMIQDDTECDAEDCARLVYVHRGACGHFVGRIREGKSAAIELLPTRSNGLADFRVSGPGGYAIYRFDGSGYRSRSGMQTRVTTDVSPRMTITLLSHAYQPEFLRGLLATSVRYLSCSERTLDRADAATHLQNGGFVTYPRNLRCDGDCCDLTPTHRDQLQAGDSLAFVTRVCVTDGEVTEVHVACDREPE